MRFKPWEYQQYAIDKILNNKKCGLFLDMGLGKTAITLTAIKELKIKTLVIAPLRVAQNTWDQEAQKWDHLKNMKISKILGTPKQRLKAISEDADVYIINREQILWLVMHHKSKWPYRMVVIDELSSFKNAKSLRFRALKKVLKYIDRVVGLTGTPAPNGLIDLWPQIYLLDGGERLETCITRYRDRYFYPGQTNGHVVYSWTLKPGAEKSIYNKINDICVSMKAEDHIKMPERIDNYVKVSMNKSEYALYQKLEQDEILTFEGGDVDALNAAVLTGKLLQMANGCVYDENKNVRHIHDRKLDALEDLIESANGKPVLVYYGFQHDRDRIMARFECRELKTPSDMTDWNNRDIEMGLAHPASCGHGLNLQDGGCTIIWYCLPWSLELYQQANARLYRQGQKETVVINHIVTTGTVDELVVKALSKKDICQRALINAVRARL